MTIVQLIVGAGVVFSAVLAFVLASFVLPPRRISLRLSAPTPAARALRALTRERSECADLKNAA